ncbi:kit ligand b [Chanos chanos]|uniref:Kit ligand n=1 Tax=Chanos chanos TaxID=29144 RepID=A0A6J2V7Z8_CHACN|nr:uncharacterized protein LOC115810079 [Chanos chanos]
MKQAKTAEITCLLLLLFSGLVVCSHVAGSPLTDDVATLDLLKENIPQDYNIPAQYIEKEVGGACWLQLNLYPVETSLKALALKFGNLSPNRANITMFITMLQGLRFTLDNEELEVTMQVFKCHYRRVRWSTGQYFNHIKDIFEAATQSPGRFHCAPPPCPAPTSPPALPGNKQHGKNGRERSKHGLLALLLIPCITFLAFSIFKSPEGFNIITGICSVKQLVLKFEERDD